jgi:hypothetical protein
LIWRSDGGGFFQTLFDACFRSGDGTSPPFEADIFASLPLTSAIVGWSDSGHKKWASLQESVDSCMSVVFPSRRRLSGCWSSPRNRLADGSLELALGRPNLPARLYAYESSPFLALIRAAADLYLSALQVVPCIRSLLLRVGPCCL